MSVHPSRSMGVWVLWIVNVRLRQKAAARQTKLQRCLSLRIASTASVGRRMYTTLNQHSEADSQVVCEHNHLGANVIRDGTTRGRDDSLSGAARCHHPARAPEGMLPLRHHCRSSHPRANCSELSKPFAEVFCTCASHSTDNIRSKRFGQWWRCPSLGRSAFFRRSVATSEQKTLSSKGSRRGPNSEAPVTPTVR